MSERECHVTRAAETLLDEYAIDTVVCCGRPFEAHDGKVTDHVVETKRVWNAQLHDLVDNIELQATDGWRLAVKLLQENWPKTIPAPMDAAAQPRPPLTGPGDPE